jgi:methylenetetrahydrofolate dehydrogenase (NADP+)/methenyltetrahydrofolate cyclohydrolase
LSAVRYEQQLIERGFAMAAKIIDGKAVADGIINEVKEEAAKLKGAGREPHLVAVQVGENPASRVYIANQKKSCEAAGIKYTLTELAGDSSLADVKGAIVKLNADDSVSGIILQMPLPKGMDPRDVQRSISPAKDVEGLNPASMGMTVYGQRDFGPCTALGAFELICSLPLEPRKEIEDWVEADIKRRNLVRKLYGHEVVVVGHSEIVGKPLSILLLNNYCTVTTCHVGTRDLALHTKNADILCSAVGVKPGLISADMIKPGAAVIDIAIIRVNETDADGNVVYQTKKDGSPKVSKKTGKPLPKKKTVGDVDFDAAKEVAGWITPVPGGVGPMTVAILLRNTIVAAKGELK